MTGMLTEDPFALRSHFKLYQLKVRHLVQETQQRRENEVRLRRERTIELKRNTVKHQQLISYKDLNQLAIDSLFEKRFHRQYMDHVKKRIKNNNVFVVQQSQPQKNIFIEYDTKDDLNYITSTFTNFSEQTISADLMDSLNSSNSDKKKSSHQQQPPRTSLTSRYDQTQFRQMIDGSLNSNSKSPDWLTSQKSFLNDNSGDTTDDELEKVELPDVVPPTITQSTNQLYIQLRRGQIQLQKLVSTSRPNTTTKFDSRQLNTRSTGEDNLVKKPKFKEVKQQEQRQTKKINTNINNNSVKPSDTISKIRKKMQSAPSTSIIDVKSNKILLTDEQQHQHQSATLKNEDVDDIIERRSSISFIHAVTSSREVDDYSSIRKYVLGTILKHLKEVPHTQMESKWTTFREFDEKFSRSILNVYSNFERIVL
ncbi:unnamed protein product [Didymodactylos carnosus]|uniref:Uncharacterized protein n=1 Tax=Didymodactylos carnosus TaxID=1234261 RepID=A0A814KJD4_9BILA|nr:unnamed protein product [Didymodactylos carnosus]CAF1193084.1 unnamed protein product [Didymodactylos carnosus]CAF3821307.1 unnamed protein product [Didymodactylos carnosus]CAF4003310.1 unnamed protein product [Didymodactylos carnosus]